jgi:hypothetical protein
MNNGQSPAAERMTRVRPAFSSTPKARMKTLTYRAGASDSGCGNALGMTSREIASPIIELMSMATAVDVSASLAAMPMDWSRWA